MRPIRINLPRPTPHFFVRMNAHRLAHSQGKAMKSIDYTFEVLPHEMPKIIRNNQKYTCSGKFRVNSNKSLSDVWLIYKSDRDNSTLNISIITRANLSKEIDAGLFDDFTHNSDEAAWKYAFDQNIMKKNNVEIDSVVPYNIEGPKIDEILAANKSMVFAHVKCKYFMKLKVKDVLKNIFYFNKNQMQELIDFEILNLNVKLENKMGNGFTFELNTSKAADLLKTYSAQRVYDDAANRKATIKKF
jgi:hypothetical protein